MILGMPVSVLEHSPFHDFLVPGIVLFTVIGLGSTCAAWLQAQRTGYADVASLFAGAALAGWIIVESIMLRSFVSLQIAYLLLGLAMVGVSLRAIARTFPRVGADQAAKPGQVSLGA